MNLKLSTANAALAILSRIRINRISNREVKDTLLNDYLALRRVVKPIDDEKSEIANKFQFDWRDEFVAVETLRREHKPVAGHRDFLVAEADANKKIFALYDKEADVETCRVPFDAFQNEFKGEEFTFEQIAALEEAGIIKI